jgi:hypothetical protein
MKKEDEEQFIPSLFVLCSVEDLNRIGQSHTTPK